MTEEQKTFNSKHTYTMCVLFGMWLKEAPQRKRLSKTSAADLFEEWIKMVANELNKDED